MLQIKQYEHVKNFSVFNGLDLRSSEETRSRGFAKEALNVMRGPTGSLDTRWGHKLRAKGVGSFGVWPYDAPNMLSALKSEILGAGSDTLVNNHNLYRQTGGTLTVGYSAGSIVVSNYWDTAASSFRYKIVRGDGTVLVNVATGTGLESSPYLISTLITAINAVSGLVALSTGDTTQPAAFIEAVIDQAVASAATYTCSFGSWTAVNKPVFFWKVDPADISVANDTIAMQFSTINGQLFNPLRNGDAVVWAERNDGVSSAPLPFVAGTTYFVVNATNTTIQLSATSGGAAINITVTGFNNIYLKSTTVNPGATFWNYAAELGSDAFRPVSSVQLRGCRYFTPGRVTSGTGTGTMSFRESVGLSKYDGQSFYRAGLPRVSYTATIGVPPTGAGTYVDAKGSLARSSVTGWNLPRYDLNYRFVDKIGNIIDGELLGEVSPTSAAGNGVVVFNMTDAQSATLISRMGFNSNYALCDATATTLTPTVSDGCFGAPRMKVGDIAYFWDNGQSRFIQREVTAVGATTLTVSATPLDLDPQSPNFDLGGTPSWRNGAAISANMRIAIWRSKGAGVDNAPKYLVNEIPWSPLYSTYYDDKPDASLGADLIVPAYPPSLPSPSRYLCIWNSQLISAGDDANPNTVSFEDIETPEGMPLGTHAFDLPRAVQGISACGDVLIAGDDTKLHAVSGDLSEFKFRVQAISDSLGVLSHASMRQVEEGIVFFESTLGPYSITNGTQLAPLGAMKYLDGRTASRVEPYFTADYSGDTLRPCFKRATSVVLPKDRVYILFVPLELPTRPGFPTRAQGVGAGSVAFVFDYGRGEWFRWTGIDYSAVCEQNGTLHYAMRGYKGFTSLTEYYLQMGCQYGQMVRDKGRYSYSDHELPLTWQFQAHWEALGSPSQLKRGIRARVSTARTLLANPSLVTLKTYIDYDTALVSTNTDISWDTRKDYKVKLNSEKCRSLMLELGASRYYEPFNLSAFELQMASEFREGMKE